MAEGIAIAREMLDRVRGRRAGRAGVGAVREGGAGARGVPRLSSPRLRYRRLASELHVDQRQTVHGVDRVRRDHARVPVGRERRDGLLDELVRVEANDAAERDRVAVAARAVLRRAVPLTVDLKRTPRGSRVPYVGHDRVTLVWRPRARAGTRRSRCSSSSQREPPRVTLAANIHQRPSISTTVASSSETSASSVRSNFHSYGALTAR